jgi:acetoin utilization protein AcuB
MPEARPTPVKSIMGKSLLTVAPDATLAAGNLAMMFARSRHVPVAKDGVVVGILSLRDVLAAELSSLRSSEAARQREARAIPVSEVMQRDPYVIDPEADARAAARLCHRHHISSIPVVRRGELVGIVTTSDLIEHAVAELAREGAELGAAPTVARLMSPSPVTTIEERAHLDLAGVLMRSGSFRHLPVMRGDRLVGILSDHDILAALTSTKTRISVAERLCEKASIEAGAVMTRSPVTITPDAPAAEAGQELVAKKIGALPVLRAGKLVGMLTERDFLSYLMAAGPASTD